MFMISAKRKRRTRFFADFLPCASQWPIKTHLTSYSADVICQTVVRSVRGTRQSLAQRDNEVDCEHARGVRTKRTQTIVRVPSGQETIIFVCGISARVSCVPFHTSHDKRCARGGQGWGAHVKRVLGGCTKDTRKGA